jgi:glycyl-tRNA synthetase beta chain
MEFLLEINTEEMPASHIKAGLEQLMAKIQDGLRNANVSVSRLKTYGTCRRLVVAGGFAPEQQDRVEEVIGPPKAVAFDADGKPTAAAIGFAKKLGMEVENLIVINTDRGEYAGARKVVKGKPTREILEQLIPQTILALSFPKMMRWSDNQVRFSRPIKNILCLFGEKPLKFSIGDVTSCDWTHGHKIFFPEKIKVINFPGYKSALADLTVLIDPDQRKKSIHKQIAKKLSSLDAKILPDGQLLEKLTYDVESPCVILGQFPGEYLRLPIEVLSTAMREGQSLFSVIKGKKQLPNFIGVADSPKDTKGLIKNGNERVLRARLEDAKFFWDQDLKIKISKRYKDLDRVVYQEKLGSYLHKTQRVKKICSYLSGKIDTKLKKKHALEAAELCKVDLLTDMVREFPSLQGKIGGLYAKEEGFPHQVWKGVYEHYQPTSMDDAIPSSLSGAVLSIADKLDSIVGALGVGVEVSGSKDPFGLRRNAQGICRIILEKRLDFSLGRLLDKTLKVYDGLFDESKNAIKNQSLDFFKGRLQHIYEHQGYRYDFVNAALAPGIDTIYHTYLRLKALDSLKESAQFEPMILIAKRVNNILRDQPLYRVNSELLYEKQERELYTTFFIIMDNVQAMIAQGEFVKAQRMVFRIKSSINNFFDNVLVMAEDKRLRRNRLALLQSISKLLMQIADYSQIVVD